MKVRLIKKQTIEQFATRNVQSKAGFTVWLAIIKRVDWQIPSDIIDTYNSADLLGSGSNRIVFNIGGNKYRMICKYHFGKTNVHLFIMWIGTHAEYSELCSKEEQYTVCQY